MHRLAPLGEQDVADMMAIERACHSHPWSEKLMRSCLSGRYFCTGLSSDNKLLGFYVAEQAGPDITLMDICVAPSEQGQGLGKVLMQSLIKDSTARNAELMFLEVRESNTAAIALYEAYGFITNGVRKKYYPDGEDALLMMKPLMGDD
ncbi:ribosomal protein S18-alanine N-acetyltransferase [Pseudoalteromonas sp. BDTF-M6]|uniref:ribosomal protein S18-alanine N-acetyltransferase n=1 Tax=Pseudoalteromonas sp. BDTF-M6 TaxID=2796132 RepID=UPI001BAE5C29|nr:ribosomal protein S18-alanine N-acetyltransferase [Pseudoalteromonas sp. BDTF-M6]MBS3798176.1 ribosomal protein S18-alanine N-acetyltransferase [Pseudoalteromonas sp. BDTF-M6]